MLAFVGGVVISILTTSLLGHTVESALVTIGLCLAWGIGVGLLEK